MSKSVKLQGETSAGYHRLRIHDVYELWNVLFFIVIIEWIFIYCQYEYENSWVTFYRLAGIVNLCYVSSGDVLMSPFYGLMPKTLGIIGTIRCMVIDVYFSVKHSVVIASQVNLWNKLNQRLEVFFCAVKVIRTVARYGHPANFFYTTCARRTRSTCARRV